MKNHMVLFQNRSILLLLSWSTFSFAVYKRGEMQRKLILAVKAMLYGLLFYRKATDWEG